MTNEQIVEKLADLPLIVRGSQDEVFKAVRELQEAARQINVSLLDSDSQAATNLNARRLIETIFKNPGWSNDELARGVNAFADNAATRMRDKCVAELSVMHTEHVENGTYPSGLGVFDVIAKRLSSLPVD